MRLVIVTIVVFLAGCTEVRGRKLIQEGTELYREGKYAAAVERFEAAEALVPALPTLWLNKGYTCRQLIAPGGKDAESRRAAACALAAFRRFGDLAPRDPRADQLALQTMFDVDDYPTLEALFLDRNRRAPDDIDYVHGLQDIYYKWGKWPQALVWSKRAAALRPGDAEVQYGVATLIWQVLSARGGATELASYDPWPRLPPGAQAARAVPVAAPPPAPAANDITGALRVSLADQGIAYLQRALALRPAYPEAMTYAGLLWRQKSFGLLTDPIAWQAAVDLADEWQRKAAATRAGKS